MAENQYNPGSVIQYSPGVATREIDLTNYVPFLGISGGAYVGEFVWGPVEKDLTVSDTNHLLNYYGKPNDQNYLDWFSAYNFLSYTNNLKIVRVVTEQTETNNISPVYAYNATAIPEYADASGVLIKNDEHYRQYIADSDTSQDFYDEKQFAARYPGVMGNSIRVSMADSRTYTNWEFRDLFDFAPGTSELGKTFGVENDEIHVVITDEYGAFTGIKGAILEKYSFLSKASDAKNLDNKPIFYGSVLNSSSNYVWYLGTPSSTETLAEENDDRLGSIEITNGGSGYLSAPVVTIDPPPGSGAQATASIGTGSRTGQIISVRPTLDGTGYPISGSGYAVAPKVVVSGGGANVTTTAVVEAVLGTGVDSGKVVRYRVINPGAGYTQIPTINIVVDTATAVAELGSDDDDDDKVVAITITNPGSGYTSVPNVTITGNATANAVMVKIHTDQWDNPYVDNVTGRARSFRSLSSIYAKTLSGGSNGERVTANEIIRGWSTLRDPETHDVSLIFTGAAGSESEMQVINQYVIDNVAEYRKDCVVFISPALEDVLNKSQAVAMKRIIERRNDLGRSSNYAVMDSGWKLQYDQFNDKYRWMPLNPDLAGLCASTDVTHDPWWSPAGYTRGKIKNCISLAFNPNKASRDEIYKVGINPVVTFVGDGTVLFGDKTLQYKPSAFSYINVRRLFIILKKSISQSAKYYLFEFNDRFTRAQFVNMVEPFLREVKGRRGIYEFKIVCDESNNSSEVIDRGEFVANILIKPTRSINYITLNMIAVKTGVDFDEVLGSV